MRVVVGGQVIFRIETRIMCLSAAAFFALACVEDDGDRPTEAPAQVFVDPGSGAFSCADDDGFDFLMFDSFEFGAALGTWYANNEICEGCQALEDSRSELLEEAADADEDVNEAITDKLDKVVADLEACKTRCRASQFPTIYDKPLPAGEIPGGRCDSKYAFHFTVEPAMLVDWGANWGTSISPPQDGSKWEGVSFWARRAPDSRGTLRIEIADRFTDGDYTDEDGNANCNAHFTDDTTADGCDRFGGFASVGTDWKFFRVPFDDMRQAGWGVSAPYFDTAGLRSLTFLFPAGYWDIWIDDVAFYRQRPN